MASGFNKVTLLGNISADPELKQTASGISVCSFSLAVNRRFAKAGEQNADFINIVAFRHNAEFITRYLKKGNAVLINGSLQTRNYTNNQGQKVYVTEVIADEVVAVSNNNAKGNDNGYPSVAFGTPSPQFEELGEDSSLPF